MKETETRLPQKIIEKPQIIPPLRKQEAEKKHITKSGKR